MNTSSIHKLILSFLFVLTALPIFAQRELFDKADAYFSANMYKDAILSYEKALALDPEQPIAISRLAESYYMTNNLMKAEEWFAKAITYSNMHKHLFGYAQTLKSNGKNEEAKKWFLEYAKTNSLKGNHFAASCDFLQKLQLSQPLFEVKTQQFNSKNADFAPVLYGTALYFASCRSVAVEKGGQLSWTNDAFNQYYSADINFENDSLRSLKPLRQFVGRDINDAPMSYTKGGDWVAVTSNNFMDGIRHIEGSGLLMDIYLYKTKNYNEWDIDSELFFPYNAGVNSEKPFSTGHPFLSSDGSTLYFSSNRPGGYGGYDIYVSKKEKNGWTEPKNLGAAINSPGNEMSPFADEFGRMYFASDWHFGFGGMDIFVSERLDNGIDWSPCQNLGKPVNSSYDDMYFVFDGRNQTGYFSSNRPGGQGNEDIYKAEMLRPLPPRARDPLKAGEKVSINDAYNSVGQFVSTSNELKGFLEALKSQSKLVVQIYVHSDSRGSAQNNLSITQLQAKNTADYFISNAIAADRIRYQGLGEQFTVNGCNDGVSCGEEDHRKNRRTDFVIIGYLNENGVFVREFEPQFRSNAVNNTQASNNSDANPNRANPNNITKMLPDVKTAPPVVNNTEPIDNEVKKPEKKSHYAVGDVIEVASIFYQPNAANVDERSPGLAGLIEVLNSHKHVIVEIGAHTDAVGTTEYNKDLSQRRADALKAYLVKKGIEAGRLQTKGYGESMIKNRCKDNVKCTDAEHAVNRRTEFKVIGHIGFKVGDIIKVAEIGYETNRDVLDMKRSKGLQEIIQILKNNTISVEIRSHTDAKGTSEVNLALSERRAKAVYDYLVANGVNKHRLKFKGYGETMIINRCKDGVNCPDAEHAQNRRTDFKVIGLK